MTTVLTADQLEAINKLVIPSSENNFIPDYAGMYQFIFDQVGDQMPDRRTWGQVANREFV